MKQIIRLVLLTASLLMAVDSYAWVVVRGGNGYRGHYYNGYAYPRAVYYGGYRAPYYGYGRTYYAPACTWVKQCYANGCIKRRVCY